MKVAGARPLRVLVVARWYPGVDDRGAGIFVADHCAALAGAGGDVRVVSFEHAPLFAGEGADKQRLAARWAAAAAARPPVATPVSWGAPGVPVARLRVVTRPRRGDGLDEVRRIEPEATSLLAFGRALHRDWPFDLIHAHTGLPDGAAAAVLASDLSLPLVTTEHDGALVRRLADDRARAAYGPVLAADRVLVAVSADLRGRLAVALGVAAERLSVVPNPVAIDDFVLADPGGREPAELLWVGNLRASKGIAPLLEALAICRRDEPDLRLRLIGRASDADGPEWRRLAGALGIGDAVTFEGPGDRPAIVAAMQRATAFVHPSRYETFGIVAAEALATGLPVVATPSGGVDEILGDDGRLGELAHGFDGAAIAAAIRRLLDRRADFDPATLRSVAVERYAPSAIAARTLELYDRVLAARPSRTPSASASATTAAPGNAPASGQPIVVGFRRTAVERQLAPLPSELRDSLRVVTTARPGPSPERPPSGWTQIPHDTIPADDAGRAPQAGFGRLAWLGRHPIAAIRRRLTARRRPSRQLERRRAVVRDVLAAASGPLTILPLDADDLMAVEPFLDERVMLSGGGLRWLADVWDQALAGPAGPLSGA